MASSKLDGICDMQAEDKILLRWWSKYGFQKDFRGSAEQLFIHLQLKFSKSWMPKSLKLSYTFCGVTLQEFICHHRKGSAFFLPLSFILDRIISQLYWLMNVDVFHVYEMQLCPLFCSHYGNESIPCYIVCRLLHKSVHYQGQACFQCRKRLLAWRSSQCYQHNL